MEYFITFCMRRLYSKSCMVFQFTPWHFTFEALKCQIKVIGCSFNFVGLCVIDHVLLDSGALRPRGLLYFTCLQNLFSRILLNLSWTLFQRRMIFWWWQIIFLHRSNIINNQQMGQSDYWTIDPPPPGPQNNNITFDFPCCMSPVWWDLHVTLVPLDSTYGFPGPPPPK